MSICFTTLDEPNAQGMSYMMTYKNGKRLASIHLLSPNASNPRGTLMDTHKHTHYTHVWLNSENDYSVNVSAIV